MKFQARLFFALLFCASAFPQGVRYDIPPILNSRAVLVPNANISLCPGTATITNSTCSPASTQAFTDITLTTPCATGSPVVLPQTNVCSGVADALGNAGFWLAPGAYIYCINGPSITGKCYNLTEPTGSTSIGGQTATGLNNVLFVGVPNSTYPATLAGINAALTQCNTNGGGIVRLVDNSLASWPTLVSASSPAINVPAACRLEVGNMSSSGGGAGLIIQPPTNGICIQMNAGSQLVGNTSVAGASGQSGSVITCQATGATTLNIQPNCNNCVVEKVNLKGASSAGNTITIQDNQRELFFQNVFISPGTGGGECVTYIPASNGFNFILFSEVRCDGYTGSAFDFKFTNASLGIGTNLIFENTYANCLPNSGCIGYDLSTVESELIGSGVDNGSIGYRLNTRTGAGANYLLTGTESQSNTTAAVQVLGAIDMIIHGMTSANDGQQVNVNASGANTWITGMQGSSTTGANSVTYSAASNGFNYLSGNTFDKPISNSGNTLTELTASYNVLPGALGLGTANGSAPTFTWEANSAALNNTHCFALDRSGANKFRLCNEQAAGQVIAGTAQDDTSLRVVSNGAFNVSTNNGTNISFAVAANNAGIKVGPSIFVSPTAPTIAGAGCGGTVATILSSNGTASFEVNTGTAPGSACTITMPAAATSWSCDASHVSAVTTTNFVIQQTGAISTTSVVLTLFSDVGGATSYQANDTLRVKCSAN